MKLWIPILTSLGLFASLAKADPYRISYAGRMVTAQGVPIAGLITVSIKFYHSQSGGSAVASYLLANVLLVLMRG